MRQLEPIMQILIFEFSPSAAHIKTSSVKNGFIIILVLIVKLKSRSRSYEGQMKVRWRSDKGQEGKSYVWVVALKYLMASLSSTSSLNSIVNEDDEEECGFQETNVRISGCHCHCPLGPGGWDQHTGNGCRASSTHDWSPARQSHTNMECMT